MSPRKSSAKRNSVVANAKPDKIGEGVVTTEETKTKEAPKRRSTAMKQTITIQYGEKEISQEQIVEKIKELWVSEGNKIGQLKTLEVYVKPEDNACYYVINDEIQGVLNF